MYRKTEKTDNFPKYQTMLTAGQPISHFELPSTGDINFSSSAHVGRILIIFFYPKDNTPGCTVEVQDFSDSWSEFIKRNCVVVGISRDTLTSHKNFKEKMNFPFELLSDVDEVVCELFDVIKMKNLYGKKVRGIERSTFVIDVNGNLIKEWRGVKVPGHVQEVLGFISTLH